MITTNFLVWIFIGILVIGLLYFISLYNSLINLKNNIKKNWSNIDVLLKQRNDELRKLIDTCKEYMGFEKSTLETMIHARNEAMKAHETQDIPALGQAEDRIRLGLGKLFALAENYPDLKTNKSFIQLQTRISDLENQIADRREFYNDSVNLNNIAIEQFPSNLVASLFHFEHQTLLVFESDRKDVDIQGLFGKS